MAYVIGMLVGMLVGVICNQVGMPLAMVCVITMLVSTIAIHTIQILNRK
jgi:hypothetical protein